MAAVHAGVLAGADSPRSKGYFRSMHEYKDAIKDLLGHRHKHAASPVPAPSTYEPQPSVDNSSDSDSPFTSHHIPNSALSGTQHTTCTAGRVGTLLHGAPVGLRAAKANTRDANRLDLDDELSLVRRTSSMPIGFHARPLTMTEASAITRSRKFPGLADMADVASGESSDDGDAIASGESVPASAGSMHSARSGGSYTGCPRPTCGAAVGRAPSRLLLCSTTSSEQPRCVLRNSSNIGDGLAPAADTSSLQHQHLQHCSPAGRTTMRTRRSSLNIDPRVMAAEMGRMSRNSSFSISVTGNPPHPLQDGSGAADDSVTIATLAAHSPGALVAAFNELASTTVSTASGPLPTFKPPTTFSLDALSATLPGAAGGATGGAGTPARRGSYASSAAPSREQSHAGGFSAAPPGAATAANAFGNCGGPARRRASRASATGDCGAGSAGSRAFAYLNDYGSNALLSEYDRIVADMQVQSTLAAHARTDLRAHGPAAAAAVGAEAADRPDHPTPHHRHDHHRFTEGSETSRDSPWPSQLSGANGAVASDGAPDVEHLRARMRARSSFVGHAGAAGAASLGAAGAAVPAGGVLSSLTADAKLGPSAQLLSELQEGERQTYARIHDRNACRMIAPKAVYAVPVLEADPWKTTGSKVKP